MLWMMLCSQLFVRVLVSCSCSLVSNSSTSNIMNARDQIHMLSTCLFAPAPTRWFAGRQRLPPISPFLGSTVSSSRLTANIALGFIITVPVLTNTTTTTTHNGFRAEPLPTRRYVAAYTPKLKLTPVPLAIGAAVIDASMYDVPGGYRAVMFDRFSGVKPNVRTARKIGIGRGKREARRANGFRLPAKARTSSFRGCRRLSYTMSASSLV